MKYLLFFSLTLVILGCSKKQVREIKDPDSGQLLEQYQIIETKDGSFLKDGFCKTWYENGQIEANGEYSKNKKTGNWLTYYENGQLKGNLNFTNDTLNGVIVGYYENSQKEFEGQVKMNRRVGEWIKWFNNGQIALTETYENDFLNGLQTKYYMNGQKKLEITYIKGVKEGEATFWHENGQKKSQGKYSNGNKSGYNWKYWNQDGTEWLNKKEIIIGVWHNGVDSKREFKTNGDCIITWDKDGTTQTIDYKVTENNLKLYFSFMSSGTFPFVHFDRNSFTIKDSNGKKWKYSRLQ